MLLLGKCSLRSALEVDNLASIYLPEVDPEIQRLEEATMKPV